MRSVRYEKYKNNSKYLSLYKKKLKKGIQNTCTVTKLVSAFALIGGLFWYLFNFNH